VRPNIGSTPRNEKKFDGTCHAPMRSASPKPVSTGCPLPMMATTSSKLVCASRTASTAAIEEVPPPGLVPRNFSGICLISTIRSAFLNGNDRRMTASTTV
jgi:hypothetical protein